MSEMSKSDKIPDYIKSYIDSVIEERYESLLENYELTLQKLDAQNAEINNLKSELIEAKNIATQTLTTNDIKSSKKYIIKPIFNDGSSDVYTNYDEIRQYFPNTTQRSKLFISENGLDRSIEMNGSHRMPLDGKKIMFASEQYMNSINGKLSDTNNSIVEMNKTIMQIKEQL